MNSTVILITGGSRSGKSRYALEKGTGLTQNKSKAFIATAPVLDNEMKERIQKHQLERVGRGWETIEEEWDIVSLLSKHSHYDLYLLDCVTLWINNLLYHRNEVSWTEEKISEECLRLVTAFQKRNKSLVLVTNEVGNGIVPEQKSVRLYRDLVGRANQVLAGLAQEVVLVTCGIPTVLKKENNEE